MCTPSINEALDLHSWRRDRFLITLLPPQTAVEVLLEAKVTQFRSALKRFRADMWSLAAYFIFTALFTVSILGKGDTKQIFYVRKAVENTLIDVGGYPGPVAMGPSEVGGVEDIYM